MSLEHSMRCRCDSCIAILRKRGREQRAAPAVTTQEEALALQIAFKERALRDAMKAIAEAALAISPCEIWPDEIDLSSIPPESKNVIGNAFKVLFRAGIIEQTGQWRNSRIAGQKGRRIWSWRLKSVALAKAFLKVDNVVPVTGQMELAV